MDHALFQDFNPLRTPGWRHDRAQALASARPRPKPASPRFDDRWVVKYRRFLLQHGAASTSEAPEVARAQLFAKDPGLYYAHMLRFETDLEWRTILESRLLARQEDDEIADLLATLPTTIDWYERLYFNVRDRIDCHDWVVKSVLGPLTQRSANRSDTVTPNQRDLLYKLFAYFGGPEVLDVAISGFSRGAVPDRQEDVPGWLDRAFQTAIRRKATMSAQVFEVDRYKVMELLNLHTSLIINARGDNAGGDESGQGLRLLLDAMPWTTASRAQRERSKADQAQALSYAEPRAAERLLAHEPAAVTLTVPARVVDVARITGGSQGKEAAS